MRSQATGVARHGRLPWLAPDDLDDKQREVHAAIAAGPRAAGPQAFALTDSTGRLEGPYNAMLFSPDVGMALQELGSAIRYRTTLEPRSRELAILVLAVERTNSFEWHAHTGVGRQVGLTEDELAGLLRHEVPSSLSSEEAIVVRLIRLLVQHEDVDDDLFVLARSTLGDRTLVELTTLIGYYDLLAMSLRFWQTPLPAGEPTVTSPFSQGEAT